MLADYENLYGNIVGKPDAEYVQTPQEQLEKVHGLKNGYIGLKDEMAEEIAQIEKQIVAPAKDARVSVKAYFKVIKKREDKKLDWERYKGRVDSLEKKVRRTDREDIALAKHQADYALAQAVCSTASLGIFVMC
jgi:vancomycin resistance protein YoaR